MQPNKQPGKAFGKILSCSLVVFHISIPTVASADLTLQQAHQLMRDTLVIDGNISLSLHSANPQPNLASRIRRVRNSLQLNGLSWTISSSLDTLTRFKNSVQNQATARVVLNSYDFERARRENKLAVMFYSQKHYPLNNDVNRLENFYNQGLRVFQIAYGGSDTANIAENERLGAGGFDQNPNYRSRHGISYNDFGLTSLGERAVAKLNQLNMLIDVSHCHEQTILDVARLSRKPIIANHANAEAVTSSGRNLSDQALRAIANSGGVIGVTAIRDFIESDRDGDQKATANDFVEHINHIVDTVGIDHVGLATDGYINGWPKNSQFYAGVELNADSRWKIVIRRLSQQRKPDGSPKYSQTDLKKILGWNFLRVYQEVLRGHTKPKLRNAEVNPNRNVSLRWTASRRINVPAISYDVHVYGKRNGNYNRIKSVRSADGLNTNILARDLKDRNGRKYDRYRWYVKSYNNVGYTNSGWGYFNF